MKSKIAALVLLPASLLTLSSCGIPATEQVTAIDAKNGAAIVDTIQTSATVTSINSAKRKLTMKFSNGVTRTVKAGPDVVNFKQIKVGDKVNATVTEELAVFIGKGAAPSAAAANAIGLAPVGAKPAVYLADAVEVTAKITAINSSKRSVTLALPDGTSQTVKVGKQVNLANVKTGDDVTVQYAEAMALNVTKG